MTPFWTDDHLTLYGGDCREVLASMPAESVHCVVTSPPYWGLRDYGVDGQIGLEATPEAYIATMVATFREVWRVLRADGTLWVNMGDSYAGNRGPTDDGDRPVHGKTISRRRDNAPIPRSDGRIAGLKPKDLVGMPWRLAFALQADGWWLRRDIVWHKPNPMPETVNDRPSTAHEYVFLLSRSARYFYDAAAVREQASGAHARRRVIPDGWNTGTGRHDAIAYSRRDRNPKAAEPGSGIRANASMQSAVNELVSERNLRSVWTIPIEPYPGAHFATFPRKLVEPCIKAGSPEGGTVLDPFAGSGTTLLVAQSLGRRGVGIDLNPDYLKQALVRNAQTPLGLTVLSVTEGDVA